MTWVVPDFESVSQCDLKKAGAARYWEDPTTEVICLAFKIMPSEVEVLWYPGDPIPPEIEPLLADPEVLWVAHNADFEKYGWRSRMVPEYGWPDIPNRRWHDTAARCANLTLPRGLDKAVTELNLPLEKDMEGNRLTLSMSRVNKKTGMQPEITPVIRERIGTYCLGDVRAQAGLHKRIGWLPPDERITYLLDQEINERGIALDVPLVRKMREVVDKASVPLAAEFKQLTGGLNFTQIGKLKDWMLDRGVVLPDMSKGTLDALFGETEDGEELDADERLDIELPPDVDRALRIRRLIGSASVKKLAAMEACVCHDDRARGLLLYHGAGPGRWSGKLIQPHNFPRGSVIEDDRQVLVDAIMTGDPGYVECLYGPAVEAVVSALRHAVVGGPGNTLVAGDFAGIEARTVLALAGQHDKCDLLASGADVYIDMAQDIYKLEKFDVTDKKLCKEFKELHLEKRQVGKNTILGCGFQMGGPKFNARYCPDQPLEFAQGVVDAYRQKWAPKVPDLWRGLQEAALRAVKDRRAVEDYGVRYELEDEWLTARLPSGRKLWYFRPRLGRKAMPWDENDIRLNWSYTATKLGRRIRVDAYGGLLTENVVQGLARDLLRDAMLKCRKEGLPIVLTVHDEIVLEVEKSRGADTEVRLGQIMADRPAWAVAMKIPVEAETWTADRYRK